MTIYDLEEGNTNDTCAVHCKNNLNWTRTEEHKAYEFEFGGSNFKEKFHWLGLLWP